jgi:lipoprotein-anchoring transpeptidase ErfK/SrfK
MRVLVAALISLALVGPALSRSREPARLDPDAVNNAGAPDQRGHGLDPGILRAQVLLDRLRFSPGLIDGRPGDNLDGAVLAYQEARELPATGKLDPTTWDRLVQESGGPVLTQVKIGPEDLKGPFVEKIPTKMEDMAKLDHLGWRSPQEELGERYHIDEKLLAQLNPKANFEEEGTTLVVPDLGPLRATAKIVKRIEVSTDEHRVRAFDKEGKLVASFPASIGSAEKPPPHGKFKVTGIAKNPVYTYNPDFGFKGVKARKPFSIKPGPNNPVGLVWIDLSAPTYGIHGPPEPRLIGKTFSHGCVRLTNWDALDLAAMVEKNAEVDFGGGEEPKRSTMR